MCFFIMLAKLERPADTDATFSFSGVSTCPLENVDKCWSRPVDALIYSSMLFAADDIMRRAESLLTKVSEMV